MVRTHQKRRAQRQRGYVLLLVMGLTVLMLVGAAAIYTASDAHRMAFGQVRNQAVAVARAQEGAELVVARLRSGALVLSAPTLACPANLTDCPATATPGVRSECCQGVYTTFNSPATGDPNYQITIFLRTVPGFSRSSTIVSSTGYSSALTSPNLTTSRVDVEVQTPVTSTMGNSIAGGS